MGELAPTAKVSSRPGAPDSLGVLRRRATREAVCLLNGLAMHTKAWYGFPAPSPARVRRRCSTTTSGRAIVRARRALLDRRIAAYLTMIMDALGIETDPLDGHLVRRVRRHSSIARQFHRPPAHPDAVRDHPLARGALRDVPGDLAALLPAGPELFELYTHYMYEKIFGEPFVVGAEGEPSVAARTLPRPLQGPDARA